jgi:TolB-like protein
MSDLLQRLRERKLVQWALAYAAGAFALLQGLDIIAQQFAWPDGVRRGITIALAIGFLVALVLAWYHGERGAQRVTGTELLILALLLAIGGVVLWRVAPGARTPISQTAAIVTEPAAVTPARAAADSKSIAVLPFENLSRDPDNAYFAEGIQDEILTRLAKIGALKVISRTSTQQYAAKPTNLPEAARQLGVANILEGSVQKAGSAVHINVQLIRAESDEHLWAESYNRKLDDVFGVEAEVAQAVADALNAKLLPEEGARTVRMPTRNSEAYDLYLRGLAHFNRANDQYNYAYLEEPEAIALFDKALEKDPGFALAAADLARSHMYMYWFGTDRTDDRLAAAKGAAERAIGLQPDLGEAHYALALHAYWGHRDYASALNELALARQTWPNSSEIEQIDAAVVRRQGHFDLAIKGFQRAAEFDPRNNSPQFDLGLTYGHLRRYADADQALVRSASLTAEPALTLIRRGENQAFWNGDLTPMRDAVAALNPESGGYKAMGYNIYQLAWWQRDFSNAAKTAEAAGDQRWYDSTNLVLQPMLLAAQAHVAAGDSVAAKPLFLKVKDKMQAAAQARPDDSDPRLALGFANAGLGLRDEAIAEARRAMTLMPTSRDAVSGPAVQSAAAKIFASVGADDEAIDLVQQLLQIPCGRVMSIALLKLDPAWDPLRKHPRFAKLLADADAKSAAQSAAKP